MKKSIMFFIGWFCALFLIEFLLVFGFLNNNDNVFLMGVLLYPITYVLFFAYGAESQDESIEDGYYRHLVSSALKKERKGK